MKVTVNRDRCVSTGNCVAHAADVFDQSEEDGTVILLLAHPPAERAADVRAAAAACPGHAIEVSE